MKWNVFSLEAVKEALKPKFVLEKVRYVTDDEEYGEGKSTRLVFRNSPACEFESRSLRHMLMWPSGRWQRSRKPPVRNRPKVRILP